MESIVIATDLVVGTGECDKVKAKNKTEAGEDQQETHVSRERDERQ
jgi:hypothetical protein